MPSPQDTPGDKNYNSYSPTNKRKDRGSQKQREASTLPEAQEAPAALSNIHLSKRLKTSHLLGNTGRSAEMSRLTVKGLQPTVVDLTRPSNFQPNTGAKKLVIKNLRTTSREDVDGYYIRTEAELNDSLTSIFSGQSPKSPLEVLCRGVEALCRRGQADKLYKSLKERCSKVLKEDVTPRMVSEAGSNNIYTLKTVLKYWAAWNEQSTLLRSIYSYLDRSYLLNASHHPSLEEMGISQFRGAVFSTSNDLGDRVVSGVCDIVALDRTGDMDRATATLLREAVVMLHVLDVYTPRFEPEFRSRSSNYFEMFAVERNQASMGDYISSCDGLLAREAHRCDAFNFDGTTKTGVLESAHSRLIEKRSSTLLDPAGLAKLIDNNSMSSLKSLYGLLCLSKIQQNLKAPFEAYIKNVGLGIVLDKDKVDDMVVRLLELKRSLDIIIRDAFQKDETFSYSLREAFGKFINDSKTTVIWGTGNSKVGEMIAKYMDALLRSGLKAVPSSLSSDVKDRDAAEKAGQASTGDEDAELDRQLEQALELFRFIEGKDVFEAFYKKDLARRLLMGRSASQDAERNMLAKLKIECGFTFTHNLEQMFKDQELARDEMMSYKQTLPDGGKQNLDLQVNVLSAAAWPTYPDVTVNLPAEVTSHIERYDRHYKHKHTGRRLTWKHSLAHSIVKARFNKGIRELLVSAFQAIVLLLFNDIEAGGNLSYEAIQNATGLVDAELQRTLQSLACAKLRILTKHPKGRDVSPTDTFTVNQVFWDPKFRVKINQIQLKETKEENKETHERVHQDRQYETQAAIVRIMKSRKTMTHPGLVSEVIEQTKKRGAVELSEIKKNIEKLIEKEYIDREDGSYVYCA